METNRIAKWLKDINGWLNPPGCESSIVSHPLHDSGCCTVGIVHEHRFAFYFWGLYSIDKDSPHAALISIDAHDDVGVTGEVIPDDLDNLNIRNRVIGQLKFEQNYKERVTLFSEVLGFRNCSISSQAFCFCSKLKWFNFPNASENFFLSTPR